MNLRDWPRRTSAVAAATLAPGVIKRASPVIGAGLAVVVLATLGEAEAPRPWRSSSPGEATKARMLEGYGRLPLRFERREVQTQYVSRGPGYTMFVMPTEMVLSLQRGNPQRTEAGEHPAVLRVKLQGARPAEMQGLDELPGKANYFIGRDAKKWRTDVAGYARLRSRGVYPGIDVLYYGSGRELEYDFVVAPGGDPTRIRLGFEGARGLRVDDEGQLVVALDGGELVNRAPRVYQEEGARKRPVQGRWILLGKDEAGFELGAHDPKRALVIDPVLSYSTYLGGDNEDLGLGIGVDGSGSVYVTGYTLSTDFPNLNPYQSDQPGYDAFVTKLSPSGNSLVYSTYLGGNATDVGFDIRVDGSGSAYVTGYTLSTDFPTQNPYQTDQSIEDVFVTKLSPSGNSLVYSTYLGGSASDFGHRIAVDAQGSAYVTGYTDSADFPTQNPFQTDQPGRDAFVTKLSPSGDSLVYSTYLGGSSTDIGHGIALDSSGSAYVTGQTDSTNFPTQNPYQADQPGTDVFVTKLSPSGTSLVYSTYLGGNSTEAGSGSRIAVDSLGSAYVTGDTDSTDFPTQNPFQTDQPGTDAFVTKLSPSGTSLVYSTYLGGSAVDVGRGIALDGAGSAYVIGDTQSTDFPTQNPYQMDQPGVDVFVTRLSPSGNSLLYSTYLGGNGGDSGHAIALDGSGSAYVTGATVSTDFPTQGPYQTDQPLVDAYVTKINLVPMDFFTLSPCRLIDTRNAAGPYGGPALAAGADRTFTLAGQCGISPAARAVSVNVAVTASTAAGNLRLYPADTPLPVVASINYSAGQTRANNAIVSLSIAGALTVRCAQASGTTHLILDVNGYFE